MEFYKLVYEGCIVTVRLLSASKPSFFRAFLMVLLTLQVSGAHPDMERNMRDQREQFVRMQAEMNKIPDHKVKDWTLHKDVDDSVYWFSRMMKRSTRDPPAGWTKDKNGEWVGPSKDEL